MSRDFSLQVGDPGADRPWHRRVGNVGESVCKKGEDGRSMLDDWKDIQYEGLWKPLVDRMGEGS